MNHNPGEIPDDTTQMEGSEKELKNLLMRVKEESLKARLKKKKIMPSNRSKRNGRSDDHCIR